MNIKVDSWAEFTRLRIAVIRIGISFAVTFFGLALALSQSAAKSEVRSSGLKSALQTMHHAKANPSIDSVVNLMGIIESDDALYRKPFPVAVGEGKNLEYVVIDDEFFETPADLAARLLSRMVENPPMTYSSRKWNELMFFENSIWRSWWKKNKSAVISGNIAIRSELREVSDVSEDQKRNEQDRLEYVREKYVEITDRQMSETQEGNHLGFYDLAEEAMSSDEKLQTIGLFFETAVSSDNGLPGAAQSVDIKNERVNFEAMANDDDGGKLNRIAIIALVCAMLVLAIYGIRMLGGGKDSEAG